MVKESPTNWSESEVMSANFGDKRLNKRFVSLLNTIGSKPTESIPASCRGWEETLAAYRFFDNSKVSVGKILSPHYESTIKRIQNEKIVLLLQDTSQISYSGRNPVKGLGPLYSEKGQGLYIHPLLAVTPERVCLGVLNARMWAREELGESTKRKQKPIEEKESMKWLEGYRVANEVAQKAFDTQIVTICDREGDIYEIFQEAGEASKQEGAHFIVRSAQNRKLATSKNKLWDEIRITESLGTIEFDLPNGNREQRKARRVIQEIRAKELTLEPPIRKGANLPSVKINVVHCVEQNPPEGEKALEWLLLSSLPINDFEQCVKVMKYYLCRWEIEIFFKVLKSGCKIEELQFKDYERLVNCIAFYMIIAWRVLFVTMLGRVCPDLPCDVLFDEQEWKAVCTITHKKKPPSTPPSLANMVRMVAQLGGFLNRKGDGEPGPTVMWRGLQRTREFSIAWGAYHAVYSADTYV